ncbi:hypothetical protein [Amycolatopsis keratiniphila]|nr:hypothetical protein [Amycolatopsis keratiniphila]
MSSDGTAAALLTVLAGSLILPLLLVGGIFLIVGVNTGSTPGPYTVVFAEAGDECGATGQYLDVHRGTAEVYGSGSAQGRLARIPRFLP